MDKFKNHVVHYLGSLSMSKSVLSVASTCIVVFVGVGAPFAFVVFSVFLLTMLACLGNMRSKAFCLFIALALALYASTKNVEGDLISYGILLDKLQGFPVSGLIEFKYITFDSFEPLFLGFAYVLSNLGGNERALVFISVFIIYQGFFYSQRAYVLILSDGAPNGFQWSLAIVVVGLCAITFSQVGHLLKQYLAMSLVAVSLAASLNGKAKFSFACFGAAVLVHNSALLLFPSLMILRCNLERLNRYKLFALMIFCLFVAEILRLSLGSLVQITSFNDGDIPFELLLLDWSLLFLILTLGVRLSKRGRSLAKKILVSAIPLVMILVLFRDVPLIFLRVYFYLDVFRSFACSLIVCVMFRQVCGYVYSKTLIACSMLFVSYAYFLFRVMSAKWVYGDGGAGILISNIFEVTDLL